MKLKELFKTSVSALLSSSSSPRIDVELLMEEVFGLKPIDVIAYPEKDLDLEKVEDFNHMLFRRLQHEPIAYILGFKDFYKYRFKVNSNVLIPRPETEFIVEKCVNSVENLQKEFQILDLGAGSGCIGLSILLDLPLSFLTSVELSKDACAVIKQNILEYSLADKVKVLNCAAESAGEKLAPKTFDFIVANPPYIPPNDPEVGKGVHLYEPHLALYAEDNGFACIKSWSQQVPELLSPGGMYLIEVGHDQAEQTKEILLELKIFNKVEIIKDYQGFGRIVCGYRSK